MRYLAIALLAMTLAAEKKANEAEAPVIPDKDRASLYYLLWQQESAQSRLALAQMATKDACAASPACARAMEAERKAEVDLDAARTNVNAAFKPLDKDGWALTPQLTYRKKESDPPPPKK